MTGNPLWDLLEAPRERSSRGRQRSAAGVIPRYLAATGHRRPSMELLAAALADYASGLPTTLAERLCGVDDPESARLAGPGLAGRRIRSRSRVGPPRRARRR